MFLAIAFPIPQRVFKKRSSSGWRASCRWWVSWLLCVGEGGGSCVPFAAEVDPANCIDPGDDACEISLAGLVLSAARCVFNVGTISLRPTSIFFERVGGVADRFTSVRFRFDGEVPSMTSPSTTGCWLSSPSPVTGLLSSSLEDRGGAVVYGTEDPAACCLASLARPLERCRKRKNFLLTNSVVVV